jgi:xylan 1,4-beta-xylosidase
MKRSTLILLSCLLLPGLGLAQSPAVTVTVDLGKKLGPMNIDRFSLGQGGFSSEPMIADRTAEIRLLKPRVIRLFLQDYYDLLPAAGKYNYSLLDPSVDSILKAGAKPLLCIVFKPKLLFPRIDQNLAAPTSWPAWEELVYNLVHHYKERNGGGWYWEVGNEFDIESGGGTPYHMTPGQYTAYYEHTVAAIRRADPQARVGGPAQAYFTADLIPALLAFCAKNKIPLDFVSWHGYHSDPQWFRKTIDSMHEQLRQFPNLHPETVIDEWNMALGEGSIDPRFQPAFIVETTFQMLEAGLDLSCYYHIRDYPFAADQFRKFYPESFVAEQEIFWDRIPNYLGLFDYENQARPSYFVFRLLERLTGARLGVDSDSPKVHGMATYDESLGATSVLLWNYSEAATDVNLRLENLPVDTHLRRYILDNGDAILDDTARLHPQPMEKITKGDHAVSVHLDPWGVTMFSIAKF